MIVKIILLLILTAICAYTDAKENKIKNKILIPFILIGIIVSLITGGFEGLKWSVIGLVVPFIALYLLYAINVFGAGDVKLFCTIGAVMGYTFVINNFVYSLFVGGIIALLMLIFSKKFIASMKRIFLYIVCIFTTKSIIPYGDSETNRKMPFGIIIFMATIIQIVTNYNFFN